ncbi:PREDICTED: vitellogenin-2-like [Camelina sativa]|uniref:Vitellogenin-2-like n=1 Tax=Camelina sativa TaxID=90675 RepID=A0ABM0UF16_CAMSA|nr:PREDICTED: vitellogenin-2-like [Camelina sativa]
MVEVKDQDMGDGMQCINHPFTKNPGGICAFCLQEKLGKLVTSSFPLPKHLASSSSSSSPSFRSDSVGSTTTASASNLSASLSLSVSGARNVANNNNKLPFLLAKKKKKMLTTASSSTTANIVYKRSQSTRTTKTSYGDSDLSPRKRNGFWSFLHLYSSKHHSSSKKVGSFNQPSSQNETKTELTESTTVGSSSSSSSASSSMSKRAGNGVGGSSGNRNGIDVIVEEDGSPNIEVTPSERKVSRSRSVGCGSKSFSGDFFERITNGFGDCTLRRVESQREGNNNKAKVSNSSSNSNPSNGVREMVRCGGIFGGFMIMTSSSSSSSSSSWVSSSSAEHHHQHQHHHHHHNHNMGHGGGRNRSWGWAFASPMRAFTSSSSGKRGRTISDSTTSKNTTPNLGAIPSLLAVSS